ncbi:dihydrofolate reductase family protein [Pontibacter silvestris]|uniref:Dihydrofolate reductase family protein n=1 Tax=Pontibacter silvestris TaxID=2305183 RepID=A0ABW4X2M4_9BACT|nr:dihydrofolate reductase family protein [Pontibacter silvestris]MCC9137058.1 dihydrofolate reductase family protein [Pontibacter silvestris]
MRKIVLYIAASLDGYIARSNGNIDWLHDEKYTIPDEDFGYSAFMKTIDTTLMGHSTYKEILSFDAPFPYLDTKNFVFSRSLKQNTEDVEFINNDAAEFIKQLKQQPGKDIWLIGGGQLNTLVLNTGLLDKIILTYIPIVLGEGIPIFTKGTKEQKLKLKQLESKQYSNGFVQAVYNI